MSIYDDSDGEKMMTWFVAKGVYRDIDLHVHDQPDGWMEKDIDE